MFFKKYPIRVVLLKRFGNMLRIAIDRGRFEHKRIKTMDGVLDQNYFFIQKEKVKIPAQEISFYYDINTAREINLLQIDRNTFFPLSFEGGKITAKYVTEQDGKQVLVDCLIYDSTIALKDGRIINIPNPITNATYDREQFLSNEIETASRLYRSKGFWERYGNIVMLMVVGFLMVMFFYIGITNYMKMSKIMADSLVTMSANIDKFADKMIQISRGTATLPVVPPS